MTPPRTPPRLIIALDLDAFYVSASRKRDPTLVGRPVGIKQKALVATISYEARAVGVKKLDTVKEALKKCPDLVLVNGEDLSYFRMLSSAICHLVQNIVWGRKVEKLGMDELYCDVTDMVDRHIDDLKDREAPSSSSSSSSCIFDLRDPGGRITEITSPIDPLVGFIYDSSVTPEHVIPPTDDPLIDHLSKRLRIAAHLASHLRWLIQDRIGLTASAGIAETKLLSKLVCSLHKPSQQTVFMPPPTHLLIHAKHPESAGRDVYTHEFLAPLDLRSVPGFGFSILETMRSSMAQRKLRAPAANGIPWRNVEAVDPKEKLSVSMARLYWTPDSLSDLFGERLGTRLWALLWGADEEPIIPAPEFPQQISIEDTFPRAIQGAETQRQLELLSYSLIRRLETELLSAPKASPSATFPASASENTTLGATTALSQAPLEFRPLDAPVDRELRPIGVEGLVRTYKELDILDWVKDAKGTLKGLEWRRYPTSLRLAIRLGWGNRTSRQGRMPVEIFELSLPRTERASIMARALQVHLKAMLGATYGSEELNLINIAALDLSEKRPDRAIGSYFSSASSTSVNERPDGMIGMKERKRDRKVAPVSGDARRTQRPRLDPDVLAELPEDLRKELLQEYGYDDGDGDGADVDGHTAAKSATAAVAAAGPRVLRRSASKAETDVEAETETEPHIICPTCGQKMQVWFQHDHDSWPSSGLPGTLSWEETSATPWRSLPSSLYSVGDEGGKVEEGEGEEERRVSALRSESESPSTSTWTSTGTSLEEAALEDAACPMCGVPLARLDMEEHQRWHEAQRRGEGWEEGDRGVPLNP